MSKPDKIIYIVNARIPNEMAHSIQITHTAEAMSVKCPEFLFVTPRTNKCVGYLPERLEKTHRMLPSIDTDRIGFFGFYLRAVTFLASLYFYLIYQFLISKLHKTKMVLYIRGEIVFGLIPFFILFPVYFETHYIRNHERWYKLLLQKMDGVIVITDRLKKKFISEYKIVAEKIVVARDAVNLNAFHEVSDIELRKFRETFPFGKKIILYTGRLSEEKGVFTLIESAKFLGDSVQVMLLGGTDSQINRLRKMYSSVANMSIVGRVPHSKVPYYLMAADVLVLPDLSTNIFNNFYTSPMKLFEYMAAGVGIVAANVPSLREVLSDNNAFFFESGNSDSLASAIKFMLGNPDEVNKRATRAKKDVEEFTWDKRTDLIMNLIDGTIR